MEQDAQIILIVIAGTMVMITLVGFILLFVVTYGKKMAEKDAQHKLAIKGKELDLLRSVIQTQESERETIGRNLHDEIGPLLSTLKLHISKYSRAFQKGELVISDLENERIFIDQIIQNVRSASHNLSPQFLLKFGLTQAIKNFVAKIENPKIQVTSNLENHALSSNVSTNSYRIVLELLNNILKHDQATQIEIQLHQLPNYLDIEIRHNGKGVTQEEFDSFEEKSSGMGLKNLKSRVLVLNAELKFTCTPSESLTFVRIPLKNE